MRHKNWRIIAIRRRVPPDNAEPSPPFSTSISGKNFMRMTINGFWHQARAFILIYACLYLGNGIAALLPMSIPGSIIGMLVLFLLLSTQLVPAQWVKPGCHLLIRYMALLFVPIGVGVMQYAELLRTQFEPVVISCTVSTLIVLVTVSGCSHLVHGRASSCKSTKTEKGADHVA